MKFLGLTIILLASISSASTTQAAVWTPPKLTSFNIDLNRNDGIFNIETAATVQIHPIWVVTSIHSQIIHSRGKKIVCQLNPVLINVTDPDYENFPEYSKLYSPDGGKSYWVNYKSQVARNLIEARINLAYLKGCDGILPLYTEIHKSYTGPTVKFTQDDTIVLLHFLSEKAHAKSLSIGLAYNEAIAIMMEPYFDFAYTSSYVGYYQHVDAYKTFTQFNKAIFNVEIGTQEKHLILCPKSKAMNVSTIIKHQDLGNWASACHLPYPGLM